MSAFKDQVASDLGSVWFSDLEEFWETHSINGIDMRVVVDNDELIRRSAKRVYTESDSGLYAGHRLIMVRASEYGAKPAIGNQIQFDTRRYKVVDVDSQSGMYVIELEAFRS